mgnify:CR=1 FL=1
MNAEMQRAAKIRRVNVEGDGNAHVFGLKGHGAVVKIGREQHHQAFFRQDQPHPGLNRGVEITRRFLLRRLVPADQLMRISLAVEFNLCPRVQPFVRRENVSRFQRPVIVI